MVGMTALAPTMLDRHAPQNDRDDAVPVDHRAPFEACGIEARPVAVRDQRRRLADLDTAVLLEELRLRGLTVVLPAGRAS